MAFLGLVFNHPLYPSHNKMASLHVLATAVERDREFISIYESMKRLVDLMFGKNLADATDDCEMCISTTGMPNNLQEKLLQNTWVGSLCTAVTILLLSTKYSQNFSSKMWKQRLRYST